MPKMKTLGVLVLVFVASIAIGLLAGPDRTIRTLSQYPALARVPGNTLENSPG